jgi:NDP-sugar pyrophosphorylase family protein
MVEIGGKPILWQFMNIYIAHGINEFFIVAGYKAEVINEYFLNLAMLCGMSPREPRSRWRSDADTQFSI